MMKGIFKMTMRTDKEIPVVFVSNKEIPVMPPSMKPVGKRKLFNPNPATKMPKQIKRLFSISRFTSILNLRKVLAKK